MAGPYHPGKNRISAERLNTTDALARRPLRVVEGSGLILQQTATGQILGVNRQELFRAAAVAGAIIKLFKVSLVNFSDTLLCYEMVENTPSENTVHVAKPWFLRGPSTWKTTKTRVNITYSEYTDAYRMRKATKVEEGVTTTQYQRLIPTYAPDDILTAVSIETGLLVPGQPTGGNEKVKWLDLNVDGRMWARA